MNPLIYFGIIEKSLERSKGYHDTHVCLRYLLLQVYVNVQELYLASRIAAHLLQ